MLESRCDFMSSKEVPQRSRRTLIEEHPHRALDGCEARLSEFQDSQRLPTGNARKPFEKLIDRRAIFEVFEERFHGHARSAEDPHPAHTFR